MMDCIYGVFGGKNPVMRKALRLARYLETFEKRYDVEAQDLSQQGGGRIKCHRCGKLHEDWKITIETISPFRTEYICEDCLINSKKRKMENTKKKNE
jgi:late competence protein required for DNA uptake (superfamily II DNA/RNA helicase)